MPATGGGIDYSQLAPRSMLRYHRDHYFAPEGIVTNKIVASVDPSGLTVGTALTLQTAANGLLFKFARRPTLILTDASGGSGGLTVTVLIIGARRGVAQQEYVTGTCTDGSATTTKATKYYDEIISVTPVNSLATAASSDALTVGIENTSFGLDFPIHAVADVISIINVSTNTEAAATAISSTTVDAANSAITGITLATTDRWDIRYISNLGTADGFSTVGVFS